MYYLLLVQIAYGRNFREDRLSAAWERCRVVRLTATALGWARASWGNVGAGIPRGARS
jgi:hypothetical protein